MALESIATGSLSRTPRSAGLQRRDHVVPLQQTVQQTDGKRITGTCGIYLVGGNGINMYLAGSVVRIGTILPSRHHDPFESLTRYGAHGLEHACRGDIVVLGL